jgi:hypothetical protein
MSRNIIFLLMYNRHKLLDLVIYVFLYSFQLSSLTQRLRSCGRMSLCVYSVLVLGSGLATG